MHNKLKEARHSFGFLCLFEAEDIKFAQFHKTTSLK